MDDLRAISVQFLQLQRDANDDTEHEDVEQHQRMLKELLTATCGVVDQENGDAAMVEMADELINHMVSFSYEEELQMDLLESFAHGKRGIITDPTSKGLGGMGAGALEAFADLFSLFPDGPVNGPARLAATPGLSYYSIERPHEKTSPMARFRRDVPRSSVTDMAPSALAVFQARLSMSNSQLAMPIQLSLPPNSSCMAVLQGGGYKFREPLLTLVYCDIESEYNFCEEVTFEPGLLNVAYHIQGDAERKLIYVADEGRIKSYEYSTGRKPLPKHTLQSKNSGPIALVQNGSRILRAGKTGIDIWTVDTLPDHGPNGDEPIGDGEIYTDDTWRDEVYTVELSPGTEPQSTITFTEGQKIHPSTWSTFHDTRTMLLAPTESVSCFGVDLETGCKITSRYLGHGGQVGGFSTSPADANSFLTSCDDGIVRLFDIRGSLPYLSVDAGSRRESVSSALYIHVDGLPIVITGGQRSEAIKVWDPRAKAIVYELATGNNSVTSMAWDAPRSMLFAATECTWMDRLGYHHEYRPARIPRSHDMDKSGDAEMDAEDEEDEEEFDDDEDEFERYWPEGAHHNETYFGYAMDAGEHRLYRYKFGVDADPSILPDYGQARPSRGGW